MVGMMWLEEFFPFVLCIFVGNVVCCFLCTVVGKILWGSRYVLRESSLGLFVFVGPQERGE